MVIASTKRKYKTVNAEFLERYNISFGNILSEKIYTIS